jgi:hypothetical protein
MTRRQNSGVYGCVLLALAAVLVCGCFYLSVVQRTVPQREMYSVLCAVIYGAILSRSPARPQPPRAPGFAASIQPLAASGAMRVQARALIATSVVLSLAVPWAWVLRSAPELSPAQLRLLAPHLFVLMSQVFCELASYYPSSSLLLRLAVPVSFTFYRLRLLLEWFGKASAAAGDTPLSYASFVSLVKTFSLTTSGGLRERAVTPDAMQALAASNLVFWIVCLFGFILVRVVPRFFLSGTPRSHADSCKSRPVSTSS